MALAEVELNTITRSIRGAMGETAGEFKQAAAASSANLNKIVKDLANTMAAQRRDTAELHNSIEESVHEAQQTTSRIDHMMSAFQESITIQTQMYGELSNIGKNIRILNNNTESFNRNVSSMLMGNGGISSLLTSGFGNVASAIAGAAVGTAVGVGAAGMMGGGFGGQGVGESGSSSEAMSFFQSKGWTKEQSAGIVGNLQTESGKNLRTNAVGDNGQAYGIAQWHPDRQRKFQEVMGVPIRQSNFKQQLEFVQWELMNSERRAGQMLKAASTAIEAARAIDYGYERSTHQHLGQRMANAVSLAKQTGTQGTTTTPAASTDAAPVATPTQKPEIMQQGPVASETASRTDPGLTPHHISGGAHGGQEHGEKVSASLPSGDIVALGKALQGMNIVVSEHPAFGGVHPEKHYPNSAHNDNVAIDINAPGGIVEAQDPVWGARFDQLAKQIQAAGYTVLWRTRGHDNHIHAQIGGKGIKGGQSVIGGQTTPTSAPAPTTPGSSTAAAITPAAPPQVAATPAATPVEQPNISQAMTPSTAAPINPMQMMGMMGGMVPGMGMIGGMMPMIAGLLENLSQSMSNVDMVNQVAVNKQAQSESLTQTMFGDREPQNQPPVSAASNQMTSSGQAYAYNNPGDTGWPDWAAMLGGNHYEELDLFKPRMSKRG